MLGASGSGKTSLVNAAVKELLRREAPGEQQPIEGIHHQLQQHEPVSERETVSAREDSSLGVSASLSHAVKGLCPAQARRVCEYSERWAREEVELTRSAEGRAAALAVEGQSSLDCLPAAPTVLPVRVRRLEPTAREKLTGGPGAPRFAARVIVSYRTHGEVEQVLGRGLVGIGLLVEATDTGSGGDMAGTPSVNNLALCSSASGRVESSDRRSSTTSRSAPLECEGVSHLTAEQLHELSAVLGVHPTRDDVEAHLSKIDLTQGYVRIPHLLNLSAT